MINLADSCKPNRPNPLPDHETAMFKPDPNSRNKAPCRRPTRAVSKHAPKRLRQVTAALLPRLALSSPPRGRLTAGFTSFTCAIDAGSVYRRKSEGDGASPVGKFRVLGGFFRAKGPRPHAAWPLREIRAADGWCDDPRSPVYNRPTRLPNRYSCETLWRNDGLYDVVLVLNYNLWPRRQGCGSAIFLHCAKDDLVPTAGCIALRPNDLRKLLPRLAKDAVLIIR